MADIIELSHSINSENVQRRGPGRPKKSTHSDDESSAPFMMPPRPPGPAAAVKLPPPDRSKEAKKAAEEAKEKEEERERVELIRKVNGYLDSRIYAPILAELDLRKFRGNESLSVAREAYNRIKSVMGMQYKRMFVHRCWDMTGKTIGQIGRSFLHLEHFAHFADELALHQDEFEPELEELAIEMSPDYVPTAKWRLVMKLMSFTYEFDMHARNAGIQPPPPTRYPSSSSGTTGKEEASHGYETDNDEADLN